MKRDTSLYVRDSERFPPGVPIRVLIADDHPVAALGLQHVLETSSVPGHPDVVVVDRVLDGESALAYTREHLEDEQRPDLIFMDVRMPPGQGGLHACKEIEHLNDENRGRPGWQQIKVIMWSAYSDPNYLEAVEDLGVDGFVLKSTYGEDIALAARVVMCFGADGEPMKCLLPADLTASWRRPRRPLAEIRSKIAALRPDQREALRYSAIAGMSAEDVASAMSVSEKKLEHLRASTYRALGIEQPGQTKLARAAYMLGVHDAQSERA